MHSAVVCGVAASLLDSSAAIAQVTRIAENASHPVISWDGRFVAFASSAALVAGDTNGVSDVFVRDRLTGTTERVSEATDGTQANARSPEGLLYQPEISISADGRFVAFLSRAGSLLGRSDVLEFPNVFVRDRSLRTTTRITFGVFSTNNQPPRVPPDIDPNNASANVVLSANGRYVAFTSTASNLVVDDFPPTRSPNPFLDTLADTFIHDRTTGTTRKVVTASQQTSALGFELSFSYDGRYLAFSTYTPLDARDVPTGQCVVDLIGVVNCPDIYVLDQTTGATELVSLTPEGAVSNRGAQHPSVSADGRYVAFASSSSTFDGTGPDLSGISVLGAYAQGQSVFVRDRLSGTTTRLTPVPNGPPLPRMHGLMMSPDASAVLYWTSQLPSVNVVTREGQQMTGLDVGPGGIPANGGATAGAISRDGTMAVFASPATNLITSDTNDVGDVFFRAVHDADADTLPDEWEQQFGLSASSSAGGNGAGGDPDGDGLTNEQELLTHHHPTNITSATRYLAEGATGFFETRISVANSGASGASVLLRFLRGDGTIMSHAVTVPARQSRKVAVSTLPGLNSAEFSTVVESDEPVIVDRQMWWDAATAYATSAERSIEAPALSWYFAEGATHSGFDLFYLLQNPSDTDAEVVVRYLLPTGAPLEKAYIVSAHSRSNIWANLEEFPSGSGNRALAATDVAAVMTVTNNVPIIAERAMYVSRSGTLFEAGHESAGATAPATQWFFAEGATGTFFDVFLLLANPSTTTDAQVRATYLLPNGTTLTKTYTIPANRRSNIWLDLETFPDGNGGQTMALADAPVSVVLDVLNGVPVVAERSMWWPGPTAATWAEAHNSFGSTETGTRWGFAEGVVLGPPTNTETFFLVANTATTPARVRVTLLFDDGGTEASREYDVLPQSRFNVPVRHEFPESLNRGFGAVIESLGPMPAPIMVERAMYNDAGGRVWAAGSDALGTRLQ